MHKCEFCNNQKLINLKKTQLLNKKATMLRCPSCNHVFKSDFKEITNNDIKDFYQKIRYNDDKIIKNQQKKQVQFLVKNKIISITEKRTVLEIGGGIHGLINIFTNSDKYALELNKMAQEKMQKNGIRIIESFKNIEENFDIIILSHVFEHIIKSPYVYISGLLRLLSEKGCLFIEVPHLAYELCVDKQNNVIFDNMTPAHYRSDTVSSYINFLKRFNTEFIIKEDITFLWKLILFFRNNHATLKNKRNRKTTLLYFPEILCHILESVLFRLRSILKQPNPNIKILILK
jgi:SAM-dependent methyltransferase